MNDTFLTVREVAKILRISTLTVYEYIKRGELSALRIGRYYRIDKSDLNSFISNHKIKMTNN